MKDALEELLAEIDTLCEVMDEAPFAEVAAYAAELAVEGEQGQLGVICANLTHLRDIFHQAGSYADDS